MPEAIATSKRRFYKALDSLSASPSSPTNPLTTTPSTTSSKRSATAAFDEARQRVTKRLRQSTSTTSLSTVGHENPVISLPRPTVPKLNNGAAKSPPTFSPWSQETFLARLKTFSSVSLWHPKPDAISEVRFAKRGWVCVGVNTLACKSCGRRLVVNVETHAEGTEANDGEEESDDEAALEAAFAERYQGLIVEGHSPTCLWYKTGCPDDIYRLPVVRPAVWQPELRKRYQSLVAILDSIETVKLRQLDPSSTKLVQDIPKDVLGLDGPPQECSDKAFDVAMHGWRGTSESGTDLLHCDACFQRVGLWMYQPEYLRKAISQDEDQGEEDVSVLDLVEMHRDHCPWRNPQTQCATGSLSGLNACQILQKVVSTAARDHRRKSDMQQPENVAPGQLDDGDPRPSSPSVLSREEIARQDKERESRLQKLKNLLHIKRRHTTKAAAQKAA